MNLKSPLMITLYVLCALTILSFSLMSLWDPLSIAGSVCLTAVFAILTFLSYTNYLNYKRKETDKRASDAYLYAEEKGDENLVNTFSYDKQTERKLKWNKFNHKIVPLTFLTLTFLCVCLVVVCVKIV